jgi:hypothetical protein
LCFSAVTGVVTVAAASPVLISAACRPFRRVWLLKDRERRERMIFIAFLYLDFLFLFLLLFLFGERRVFFRFFIFNKTRTGSPC